MFGVSSFIRFSFDETHNLRHLFSNGILQRRRLLDTFVLSLYFVMSLTARDRFQVYFDETQNYVTKVLICEH